KPPLPTARNLPFQSALGIQSSALMCESLDGLSTSFTRQCAGIGCAAAPRPPAGAAGAGAPPRPGCTNGPTGTDSALTIVTLGIVTDFRDSHVAAPAVDASSAEPRTAKSAEVLIVMDRSPGGSEDAPLRTTDD